jgi:membrane protease YdiL (CAAX protease family)
VSVALGIIFTSLVFGAIHFDQWPAPIPLFMLALIIGSVYYRTGSLIAAICMHATFNGFSTLGLFVAVLAGHGNEASKAVKGALLAPAAVVSVERAVWGGVPSQANVEFRNSNGFLVDERVPY